MVVPDYTGNADAFSTYSDLAGLEFALSLIDYSPCERVFGKDPPPGSKLGKGRPRYPRIPIVKAFLGAYIVGAVGRQGTVNKLNNNPALRRACGWPTDRKIASRSTVSRVFGKLADNPWALHAMLVQLVNAVYELHPRFGKILAIDAAGVPAYCNPNNVETRDQEAARGKVHDPRSTEPDGMVWIFGWKAHVKVDAYTQLPIAFDITTAKDHESPYLKKMNSWSKENYYWYAPAIVLADRGYDGRENVDEIHASNAAPIIPRIERPNRSNSSIHTLKGEPVCLGGKAMAFIGTDSQAGKHGFRCPDGGCHRLQEPFKGYTVCDDEVWESFDDDPYTLGGLISRASPHWERFYRYRWSVERFFAWWFENGWVENHTCRGKARVGLHFLLSIVMFNAMALARMIQLGPEADLSGMLQMA